VLIGDGCIPIEVAYTEMLALNSTKLRLAIPPCLASTKSALMVETAGGDFAGASRPSRRHL
jgi:hypothetical protein